MTASLLLLLAAVACAAAQEPAGLSIERDDAEILLGESGDVRLARGDGGALSVSGEVVANGTALLAAVQQLVANVTALRQTVEAQAAQLEAAAAQEAVVVAGLTAQLEAQADEIGTLKSQMAAFGSLDSKSAIDAAIAGAAEPGRLAKEVTDALGTFTDETSINDAIDAAAADGLAAKAVTDALETVVVQGNVQAGLTAAADSVVDASRLADGAVTTEKLATPTIHGIYSPIFELSTGLDVVNRVGTVIDSGGVSFHLDGKILTMFGTLALTGVASNIPQFFNMFFPPEVEAQIDALDSQFIGRSCQGVVAPRYEFVPENFRLQPVGSAQGAFFPALGRNVLRIGFTWQNVPVGPHLDVMVNCNIRKQGT